MLKRLLGALCLMCGQAAAAEGVVLAAPEALEAQRAGKLAIIDVRTPREWQATGVPAGAARIEWGQAEEAFVAAVLQRAKGDKAAPLALICRSGNRSARARALLVKNGFTGVADIAEGVEGGAYGPGWLRRGLPVER
jgi:rhodanese-related sulfurtransferase